MIPDFCAFLHSNTMSARYAGRRRSCTCIMCSFARTGVMTFGPTLSRSAADAMSEYIAARKMLSLPTYAKHVQTSWRICKTD